MGITAGVIGTIPVAIFISYGFVPESVFIWSSDKTALLAPFLMAVFGAIIVVCRLVDPDSFRPYRILLRQAGQSSSDFTASWGDGPVLVNIGVPVLVGSAPSASTRSTAFPVVAGVYRATLMKHADPSTRGLVLAALFSATLAPFFGSIGWYWGVVGGAIHVSAAHTVCELHGGFTLYNKGFAAGFVGALLAPVVLALKTGKSGRSEEKI